MYCLLFLWGVVWWWAMVLDLMGLVSKGSWVFVEVVGVEVRRLEQLLITGSKVIRLKLTFALKIFRSNLFFYHLFHSADRKINIQYILTYARNFLAYLFVFALLFIVKVSKITPWSVLESRRLNTYGWVSCNILTCGIKLYNANFLNLIYLYRLLEAKHSC